MNEKIAKEAAAFYLTGKKLMDYYVSMPGRIGGIATEEDMLVIPLIVNMAFSCELFFKCMLPDSELGKGSGHKLKDLYDRQTTDIKKKILSEVIKRFDKDEQWFNETLTSSSDAFYQWRYFYETTQLHVSLSFIQSVAEFFYKMYKQEFK